ncbi:glutamine synthetase, putative, partial [Trypanosoma cruzi]
SKHLVKKPQDLRKGRRQQPQREGNKTADRHPHVDVHTTSEWAGSTDRTARKHTHQIRKTKVALNRQELHAQNKFKKWRFSREIRFSDDGTDTSQALLANLPSQVRRKTQRNKKRAQRRKKKIILLTDQVAGRPRASGKNKTSLRSCRGGRLATFLPSPRSAHPLPQIICSGHVPAAKHRAAGSRGTVLGTGVRGGRGNAEGASKSEFGGGRCSED